MLTDEEIAYLFRRAADILDGGPADPDPGDGYEDKPEEPQNDDPWGPDVDTRQTSQRGSQSRSGSSRGTQGRTSGSAPRGSARGGQRSDRAQNRSSRAGADVPKSGEYDGPNGQAWEFGLDDAPSCAHRMPAAFVTGDKRNGGQYHAWACPIGFTDQWKDKCDLWEFTR